MTRFAKATLALLLLSLVACDRRSSESSSAFAEPSPFQKPPEAIWSEHDRAAGKHHQTGSIREIQAGRAEISSDNGKSWKPVAAGMAVSVGTIIRTDSEGSVVFSLDENGPYLVATPLSWIRIVHSGLENTGIEIISEVMIELERGKLHGNLSKMSPASFFMVRTQKGVVEPFGKFEISADGAVRAEGGRVYADGSKYEITPGQDFLF